MNVVIITLVISTNQICLRHRKTSENAPATAQADTQEMPNVDDYIAQKAAVYRLQQDMTNWERKVRSVLFSRDCPRFVPSSPHTSR